jgi:hypothetical protein
VRATFGDAIGKIIYSTKFRQAFLIVPFGSADQVQSIRIDNPTVAIGSSRVTLITRTTVIGEDYQIMDHASLILDTRRGS